MLAAAEFAADNAPWLGPAIGYGAYRATRAARNYFLPNNQMPMQQRGYKRTAQATAFNKRRKQRNFRRQQPIRPQASLDQVAYTKLRDLGGNFNGTRTAAGHVVLTARLQDFITCQAYTRYRQLYEYVKILAMKVTIYVKDPNATPIAWSYVQFDDDDTQEDANVYMKQPNLWTHQLSQTKPNSRRVDLGKMPRFREWHKTGEVTADFATGNDYKAAIKLMIPNAPVNTVIQIWKEYTVAFKGIKETTVADTIVVS